MDTRSILWPRGVTPYLNVSKATLANLSQSLNTTHQEVAIAFTYEGSYLKESIISAALLTLFFGLFTVLTTVATYILFSRGIKRTATAVMLVAIVIMWMSTVSDWIATLVAAVEDYRAIQDLTLRSLRRMTDMQDCIGALPGSEATLSCLQQAPLTKLLDSPVHSIQNCTNTAALTVNVVIGDAIVWWRAWVLWPGDSLIRCMCVVMILATMVLGSMDTATTCGAQVPGWVLINPSRVALFSLLTNAVATTLIAYRAWTHRRLIMSYLKGSSPRTQVERTLALLVESGLLFCAFWVIIVVYEFSEVKYPAFEVSAFAHGLYYVIRGCLIPLIGMYPTVVIIVCAVDKSLFEKSTRANSEVGNASIVFNGAPPTRRRGTLSELLGASSACRGASSE